MCMGAKMSDSEPQPEPEPEAHERDCFEAMGLGPDLYSYRAPYRQYMSSAASSLAHHSALGSLHDEDLRRQYTAAARAIAGADFLLVGAGAGMGVDSGLAAYADVAAVPAWASRGHDYSSLCRPALMEEDPALFYGFWGECYNRYLDAEPHEGYAILRRWCAEVLPARAAPANHWVYTSNVDGHFLRAGFARECVLELHGGCTGEQ
eukprot:SAG11_NODE_5929_length_1431_cov_2.331832_1_plen_205_part_10